MLTCLIIDDDPFTCDLIKHFCQKTSSIDIAISVGESLNALRLMANQSIDFIFLDYQLPDVTGQTFLEMVDHQIPIITISSDKDFLKRSSQYEHVVAHLYKPFNYQDFEKAVSAIMKFLNISTSYSKRDLFVKSGSESFQIEFDNVLFFSLSDDQVHAQFRDKLHSLKLTKAALKSGLPEHFFDIGEYIINTQAITRIENRNLIIQDYVIQADQEAVVRLTNYLKLY